MPSFVYFDIETTGLDPLADEFKCAVFERDREVVSFTDIDTMVRFILECPPDCVFVTFNGAGFDWRFIVAKVADVRTKAQLCQICLRRHVDIMLDFLCHFGYRASMASFGVELGQAKTWDGASAAEADADIADVIAYCANDVVVLRTIHEAGRKNGWLRRRTNGGKVQVWGLVAPEAFRMVHECVDVVEVMPPDQGWMTSKVNIASVTAWCAPCFEAVVGT